VATFGAPIVPTITPEAVNVSISFNLTAAVLLTNSTTNTTTALNVFQLSNTAFADGFFGVEQRGTTAFLVANLTFLSADFDVSWVCGIRRSVKRRAHLPLFLCLF
jgi:hypothetical protein